MLGNSMLIRPTFFDESMAILANNFFNSHDEYEDGFYFEEYDDNFKMEIDSYGRDLDEFSVEIEDEAYLKVSYFHQSENCTRAFECKEFIPLGADPSTLRASIEDNKLIITVDKIHE